MVSVGSFPTENKCDRYVNKDEGIKSYLQEGYETSYNNIHEY